ncbi:MAG: zinc-finger domain-containing protein [Pseudomonadota bacterium]
MRPRHGPHAPAPPEVIVVNTMRISCDGGEGALGHPRVWLSISPSTGCVECGYCDRKFIHQDWLEDTAAE